MSSLKWPTSFSANELSYSKLPMLESDNWAIKKLARPGAYKISIIPCQFFPHSVDFKLGALSCCWSISLPSSFAYLFSLSVLADKHSTDKFEGWSVVGVKRRDKLLLVLSYFHFLIFLERPAVGPPGWLLPRNFYYLAKTQGWKTWRRFLVCGLCWEMVDIALHISKFYA